MKRMFTWILVWTILLCLPLFAATAESPASDFEWEVNDDGGVTVTKYTGSGEDVVIPAQIDGKPVTAIGFGAFYLCSSLTSVTIPDSVTFIADGAFSRCFSLASVTIPDSVTFIDEFAFASCFSLTSVTIPNPNIQLGSKVFSRSPLQELVLPEDARYVFTSSGLLAETAGESGVTILDYFGQDTVLEIPAQINGLPVTAIGDHAFSSCYNLTSVILPDSVSSIGICPFIDCPSLTDIKASERVLQLVKDSGFELP